MANKINIEIDGKNQGAIRSINGVKSALHPGLSGAVSGISNMLGSLQTKLALMGSAAVSAFGVMIKKAIDTADNFAKMSQRVGVSVEALSTLSYAADLSGTSLEALETGLGRLSRNLFDVSNGVGQTAKYGFEALGLSVFDVNGKLRMTEDVLLDVADKFSRMKDGTEKTAVAMTLFGRSGAQLIPLLNEGSAGIRQLQQEARKLGIEIDTNTAHNAEIFNDNLTRLETSMTGVATTVASELLPSLTKISDAMVSVSGETNTLKEHLSFLGDIIKVIATAGSFAFTNFLTIWTSVIGLIKTGAKSATLDFEGAGAELIKTLDNIGENYIRFGEFVGNLWSEIIPQDDTFAGALHGFENLINLPGNTPEIKNKIEKQVIEIGEVYARGYEQINMSIIPLIDYRAEYEKAKLREITTAEEFEWGLRQGYAEIALGNMSNAAMAFYDASGQRSKQAFDLFKALSIAQTAVATYVAATAALEPPPIGAGPLFGPILAATTVAMGLANIARISSMQPGGGFGGGVPSAAPSLPVSNTTNNMQRSITQNITIVGNVTGEDRDRIARELLDAFRKANEDGA